MLRTAILSSTKIISRNVLSTTTQYRLLTTATPKKESNEDLPKPELYGHFREPPTVLGVIELPEVNNNDWIQKSKQRVKDMVNYEKVFAAHAAERKYLVEQATKSYFADMHEMRKHGGKMYYASTQLMSKDDTGYMPMYEGKDLYGNKVNITMKLRNKISLMSFVFAKSGELHVNTFIEPFLKKFKDDKDAQLIEVNVQENFLKQFIVKAFVPSIRKSLPAERKENYMLLMQDISRSRKYLDMTNQYIGYVFLIDQEGLIRWTAHGEATKEEVANMLAMTDYLKEKMIKKKE